MKKEWLILITIVAIIAVIAISDWNKSYSKSNQTNSEVTVVVEYKSVSDNKNMTFAVTLDTHSVDLDSFDFQKDIVLEKEGKSTTPSKATNSGSGHHRSGEITFEETSPPFTITLKNLAGVERREFRFEKL